MFGIKSEKAVAGKSDTCPAKKPERVNKNTLTHLTFSSADTVRLEYPLRALGDVLEAVGPELDTAVPPRHDDEAVVRVQDAQDVGHLRAGAVLAVVVVVRVTCVEIKI